MYVWSVNCGGEVWNGSVKAEFGVWRLKNECEILKLTVEFGCPAPESPTIFSCYVLDGCFWNNLDFDLRRFLAQIGGNCSTISTPFFLMFFFQLAIFFRSPFTPFEIVRFLKFAAILSDISHFAPFLSGAIYASAVYAAPFIPRIMSVG